MQLRGPSASARLGMTSINFIFILPCTKSADRFVLGAIVGTFLSREPRAEARFAELSVRANTGLGAEKATKE